MAVNSVESILQLNALPEPEEYNGNNKSSLTDRNKSRTKVSLLVVLIVSVGVVMTLAVYYVRSTRPKEPTETTPLLRTRSNNQLVQVF